MPPKKKEKVDISLIDVQAWQKPGKLAWVEIWDDKEIEPEYFLMVKIDSIDVDTKLAKVTYVGDEKPGPPEIYVNKLLERADEAQSIDDLVDIDPLNDAELLRCIQTRLKNDVVYSYCGPTLIAMNPYKRISTMLLPEDKVIFRTFALNGGKRPLKPHIWNLAGTTFNQLFTNDQKQAICISGESGAGKTYGTRLCMAFITSLFEDEDAGKSGENDVPIEDKILASNPVMESFGNAKTVRNDNSSRFGKYFIMFVDRKDKRIKGAEVRNYLLEKSRIVIQAKGERNYHVFYCVLGFMTEDQLKKYKYKRDPSIYEYLKCSGCYTIPKESVDDEEFFRDLCSSFNNLGFQQEEQDAIWKILSCVLNLGNIPIDTSTYEDSVTPCKLTKNEYLDNVLELLGVDIEGLEKAITQSVRIFNGEEVATPRSPAQCESIRDALAKDLFNNTFNWIVRKLNLTLLPENPSQYTSIGLLDIFGFEDFDINSIEQFCINYTNERLQNLYIECVFETEKKVFREEGLGSATDLIQYKSNIPVIEMLDKAPMGIFHLIDSAGTSNKDDMALVSSIRNAHSKNPLFIDNKLKHEFFGIKHTAKDVSYFIISFVEKNQDELPELLVNHLKTGDKEINKIFQLKLTHDEVLEEKVKDRKDKFLGYKFRMEMQSLMDELLSCECNFVRCLKPNEKQKGDLWDPILALKQVRYLGVLDSIKVRKESLPVRTLFENFYRKYQDIDDRSAERNTPFLKLKDKNPNWKTLVNSVMDSIGEYDKTQIIFGNTKVFMSVVMQNKLAEILEVKQKVKIEALQTIHESFTKFNITEEWGRWRGSKAKVLILSRNLLKTWNSKVEYTKFKKVLSIVKRIQMNFRMTKYKRGIRLQKHSVEVVARSFNMFKIRKILFTANRIIVSLNKASKKMLFRAFMARLHLNKRIVNSIFEDAWIEIESKMKAEAGKSVQRIFRGYKSRMSSLTEVKRLKEIKEEVKKNRAATSVQKMAKGFLVRQRMDRLHRAASFVQGYTRMIWLSKYFQIVKIASRKIQNAYRKHHIRKKKIDERMFNFLSKNKQHVDYLRKVEHDVIFRGIESFNDFENLEYFSKAKFFEKESAFKKNIPIVKSFVPEPPAIDLNPKMRLFSILIDFDCHVDTSDIYEQSWAIDFLNFLKRLEAVNSRLLHLEVGESFTIAITDELNVYSWGLNDYQQLARPMNVAKSHFGPILSKALSGCSPRIISAGDEHNIMVDYHNEVYVWGGNMNGQLGLGHSRRTDNIVKLTGVGKGTKNIAAKGNKTYIVTHDGDILHWPHPGMSNKFSPKLADISERHIKFSNISCGYGFAIALSDNGLVFSHGINSFGQLAQGDTIDRDTFTLVSHFREIGEKITEVSCGAQHTICKSTGGKVYTWGLGTEGQLGIGSKKASRLPIHVRLGPTKMRNYKAISVQGGYSCSYVLLDNRKVYHAGANTSTSKHNTYFNEFEYEEKVFKGKLQDEFSPLKLFCKWSKAISICYLTIGDFREVDQSKKVRDKLTTQINVSWESCYNQGKFTI